MSTIASHVRLAYLTVAGAPVAPASGAGARRPRWPRLAVVAFVLVGVAVTFPLGRAQGATPPPQYVVADLGDLSPSCPNDPASGFWPPPSFAGATAINNTGEVVGWAQDCAYDNSFHAVKWSAGTLSDLAALSNAYNSAALAINDAGTAVGWSSWFANLGQYAVVFTGSHSEPIDIGALAWGGPCPYDVECEMGAQSYATNINTRGEVVGESTVTPDDLSVSHPFYYFAGRLYDNQAGLLGSQQRTIGTNTWGQTVSGRTVPVGNYFLPPSADPTLTRDGVVTHLNSVTGTGSGLTLIDAADINDHGQIAGTAATTDCVDGACVPATHLYRLSDESPPSCALAGFGTNSQGQAYVSMTVQDSLSGLKAITPTQLRDVTVSPAVWTVGTPRPELATATMTKGARSALVELQAVDIAGNIVNCDPAVLVTAVAGAPVPRTVTGVTHDQHLLNITNGTPGVENLALTVDGHAMPPLHLRDEQRQTIDLAPVLTARTNTVTITALGKPGGNALITLSHVSP